VRDSYLLTKTYDISSSRYPGVLLVCRPLGSNFVVAPSFSPSFYTFIFQLSGLAHVAPLWFLLTAEYAEGDRAQSEGQQYPQAL